MRPQIGADMGILAHHVPTIEPLRAGVVEVIDANGQSKKWFGGYTFLAHLVNANLTPIFNCGFATVHPNNKLTINAVEAAPLEDFSPEVNRYPIV